MITELMNVGAAVKDQAAAIVTTGTDIRPRLAEVVTQNAGGSQQAGGLVGLLRSVADGAREGFARAVPHDRDDALRQVVDALGDGVSHTALAARLALQEAASTSLQYAGEDLARLRDDLTAVRDLFTETVDQGLATGKAMTAGQVAAARRHAERVANRLGPAVSQALDAIRHHPVGFAREGVQAGVNAGQCAAGALFQAIGGMLRRAGDQMRQEGAANRTPSGDRGATEETTNETKGKVGRRSS